MANLLKKLFQINKLKVYHMNKNDLIRVESKISSKIIPIDEINYSRVLDMRGEDTVKSFYRMLNDNQLGIFAEVNGKIVAHAWLQIAGNNKKNYNSGFGKLNSNEAIIHFVHTDPKYRGNNISPSLFYYLADIYFNENPNGIIYITTSIDNYSSQKGLSKLGFKYLENRAIFKICKYLKFVG